MRKLKGIGVSFLMIGIVCMLSSLTIAAEERIYTCYKLTKEPVLDGKLDDTGWKNVPEESGFVKRASNSLTSKQTYFKMGYTGQGIYIGIKCEEPEIEKVKAELKDMEKLWKDDSIEIFIFPKQAENYLQFIVNAIGSRWNGIGVYGLPQHIWDWQAKTYQGKGCWSVEIKIPFEIFEEIPKKGEIWHGNICRNIFTSRDKYSCWAAKCGGYHSTRDFAKIIFKDALLPEEVAKIEKNLIKRHLRKKVKKTESLIRKSEEARRQEIAQSKISLAILKKQLKQSGFHYDESWLVDKRLYGKRGPAYIKRVDPAKWSLVKDPVTREDFGGGFVGNVQNSEVYCMPPYDLGRYARLYELPSRKALENMAQHNILVTTHVSSVVSVEKHQEIKEIMGRNFLGYEVGEQDGWYIGIFAPHYKPDSRKQAQKLFWNWHEENWNVRIHHFATAVGSMNFPHEYGAMGYRMLGYEDSQGLPSTMMRWAFMRGASKQYGLLTYSVISTHNRFAVKIYTDYCKHGRTISSGFPCGPDKGPSLSLLKRLYYALFMYGASSIGYEIPMLSCVTEEKDKEGYPKLSPLGEINLKAVKWCRKHSKERGVQYTPVALLTDFGSGWMPPEHLMSSRRYLVWGNMPYEKRDYQIDNFFRWIYPQYEECSFFRDERGFLTPTPFGDKFDVLTSDAHQHILNQYQAVCLLGELEMTPDLIIKLNQFVENGGDLIVSAPQAKILGVEFCGVLVSDKMHCGHGGLSLSDQKVFEEKEYIYTEVVPKKAKVLAVSGNKLPLITAAESGKGRVIVITPDYWMTIRLEVDDGYNVHPQRYELLKVVQHILGQYFNDLDFIKIQGPEIQYIVNLTEDNKRLVLTLVNNDREVDWKGTVSLKEGKIVSAKEWMEEKELRSRQPIKISVPKGDLKVIEIMANRALFQPVSN